MVYSPGIRAALLSLAALLFFSHAPVRAELTQEQVKAAKAATGFVITGEGSGTAFCISESGIFVTCYHVVAEAGNNISIIVSPAGKQEKRYPATVVKLLPDANLAILQVRVDPPASVLKLGDDSNLYETEALYAFGYPFGKMLAADEKSNPSISVNVGRVTALRMKGTALDAREHYVSRRSGHGV